MATLGEALQQRGGDRGGRAPTRSSRLGCSTASTGRSPGSATGRRRWRPCDLTPRVLREWLDKLATTRTARPGERNESGRTLSASSIRHVVVTLRQLAKDNDAKIEIPQVSSLRQKRRKTRPPGAAIDRRRARAPRGLP